MKVRRLPDPATVALAAMLTMVPPALIAAVPPALIAAVPPALTAAVPPAAWATPPAAAASTGAPLPAAGPDSPASVPAPGSAPATAPITSGAPPAGASIALLLPLSGRQAAAGDTVRDGFLTAWYAAPGADRPPLRLYDTAQLGVAGAIANATTDGAALLVGPLTREDVAAAADYTGSHPPILALNALGADRVLIGNFWQFALSPEDEARQAARRVLADGHHSGIALVPAGDWGNRVLAAFRTELAADGGELLDTRVYDPGSNDYADAIERALHTDESAARRKRLEAVLGTKLQFQPRRRGDIGFIFAPGQAGSERLLRPQLRYYFAGDVATYATADAFLPNPNANLDLDGLIFPDSPWMLGGALPDSVREAANAAWPVGGPRRNELFAFGFDAWRLAAALRAQSNPGSIAVDGLSGHLSIGEDGRVHRELIWAQIRNGEPHLLSDAPPAPATPPAEAESSGGAATGTR